MKKVLITGKNSYIGNAVAEHLASFPASYEVDCLSLRDGSWREKSFSDYDCVLHVAGIAHSDVGGVSEERKAEYYRVNTDLTVEVAGKAKKDGVGQFIFMSSAIVYGDSAPVGKEKRITRETEPVPSNFYGDTKLQAEKGIQPLASEEFAVAIVRPPMIYGPGSRGNYPLLSKMAQKLPVFPKVENRRSMLYIGNLTEFLRLLMDNGDSGIFWPQNKEYSCTSELVSMIAKAHGKRIWMIPGFAWALKLLAPVTGLVNKAFGNLVYDQTLSEYKDEYRHLGWAESIAVTEGTKP